MPRPLSSPCPLLILREGFGLETHPFKLRDKTFHLVCKVGSRLAFAIVPILLLLVVYLILFLCLVFFSCFHLFCVLTFALVFDMIFFVCSVFVFHCHRFRSAFVSLDFFFDQKGQSRECQVPQWAKFEAKYRFRQSQGVHTGLSSWLGPHVFPLRLVLSC